MLGHYQILTGSGHGCKAWIGRSRNRRPLPLNTELIKEKISLSLQTFWKESWSLSPRKDRMVAIDPTFSFDKFHNLQQDLTRAQSSLIFQIRSNHIPLNVYLNRIGKSESKFCPNCASNGQEIAETVTHFLFECPRYDYERHSLDTKVGCSSRDLRIILSSKEMTCELIKFVGRTKQLQNTLGDMSTFCSVAKDSQDG